MTFNKGDHNEHFTSSLGLTELQVFSVDGYDLGS